MCVCEFGAHLTRLDKIGCYKLKLPLMMYSQILKIDLLVDNPDNEVLLLTALTITVTIK